eukprot:2943015-Pleurochrysis_carterae.AAC.1
MPPSARDRTPLAPARTSADSASDTSVATTADTRTTGAARTKRSCRTGRFNSRFDSRQQWQHCSCIAKHFGTEPDTTTAVATEHCKAERFRSEY